MAGARWTTLSELERREPEWRSLGAESEFPTAYSDPRWLLPWCRHYGDAYEPWPLVLEDAGGGLRGMVLLALARAGTPSTLTFAAARWNGFDMPLAAPGAGEELAEALAEALRERRKEWDLWRIGRLPAEAPLAPLLLGGAAGLRASAHDVRLQPYLELPGEIDAFESRFGGKRRTEFRRRWRRLLDQGAEARLLSEPDAAERDVAALLELRRTRAAATGQPHAHMDARFERFTLDAVRALLPDGVRLWTLELNGTTLTSKLNFVQAWREHGYISAVSDEQLGLSPGHALERQVIHAMITDGRAEFDLGPGRDEYKYRWGAIDREVVRMVVPSPTARGRIFGSPASIDLRLRDSAAAAALRRRRGMVPERATAELPARLPPEPEPESAPTARQAGG